MRENRTSGSEGGAAQPNASSLPLSGCVIKFREFMVLCRFLWKIQLPGERTVRKSTPFTGLGCYQRDQCFVPADREIVGGKGCQGCRGRREEHPCV